MGKQTCQQQAVLQHYSSSITATKNTYLHQFNYYCLLATLQPFNPLSRPQFTMSDNADPQNTPPPAIEEPDGPQQGGPAPQSSPDSAPGPESEPQPDPTPDPISELQPEATLDSLRVPVPDLASNPTSNLETEAEPEPQVDAVEPKAHSTTDPTPKSVPNPAPDPASTELEAPPAPSVEPEPADEEATTLPAFGPVPEPAIAEHEALQASERIAKPDIEALEVPHISEPSLPIDPTIRTIELPPLPEVPGSIISRYMEAFLLN